MLYLTRENESDGAVVVARDGDGDGGGGMPLFKEGEDIRRPMSGEREVKSEPGMDVDV